MYQMRYLAADFFKRLIKASIFSNFVNLSSIQLSNTLLLILIYPIITRQVGLEAFGLLMVASAFAGLMSVVVNFGTSQSGVRDIAFNKDTPYALSLTFYNTLLVRIVIFTLFIIIFSLLGLGDLPNYKYYLFSVPLIFAEVVNPMFLYLGKENLTAYNIANLLAKIFIILSVFILIDNASDAIWVNFLIGAINSVIYLFLIIRGVIQYRIPFQIPATSDLFKLVKTNSYLVGNNISVHLQQSLMLFALARWGNPLWLGAYSICDKIIWSSKIMIMSISNSIYPRAARFYREEPALFTDFNKKMKRMLGFMFICLSLCLMLFAGPVIYLATGQHDPTAETILRIMAFLPTLAALNVINVQEMLIRDQNHFIFKIAMILLIQASAFSVIFTIWGNLYWVGSYTLLIELSALVMYEYIIQKKFYRTSGI